MSLEGLPQPLPADEDRASQLYAAFWTPIPILASILAARFYVRLNMKNLGLDDWFMLLGFIFFIITNIMGTLFVEAGGSRHLYYIQPTSQLIKVMHLAFLAQPFGVLTGALAKTSVAGLTLRIAGPNTFWRKWIIYVGIFFLWALSIADIAVKCTQCDPMRANWDVTIPPTDKRCWDPKIGASVSITNASFGTFMDFVLAIIPCTIVWNLKVDQKTKLALMGFLGLGFFAGIGSAIKTHQLNLLSNRMDFTWGVYDMYIWTEVELSLVFFCGCIPPIKPLFDWMRKGKPIVPSGSGSGANKSYKSWKMSSPSTTGQRSVTSNAPFTKIEQSGVADDENQLWRRPKEGQIIVSRHYDVDSQSAPSVHSAEGRGVPANVRQQV